jgi:hypothetical protein
MAPNLCVVKGESEGATMNQKTPIQDVSVGSSTDTSDYQREESFQVQMDGLFAWPDDRFFDATFDWFPLE